MKKYISGRAKKCMQGHFYTNTVEAYVHARNKLAGRYGDKCEITKSFRNRLDNWPNIRARDGKGLRDLSDFLSHLTAAMESVPSLRILNDKQENEKTRKKLPDRLRSRWSREVDRAEERDKKFPSRNFFNF